MTRHALLLKSKPNGLKSPARVIPITNTGKKKGQSDEPKHGNKSKGELPLYNNERIFKPKEHDPL
jgi:hypothetical protein